jgi:acyl-CoA synthetase (AMP-forming)/AMP-acid ligase II/acyl carrier protein
MFPALANDLSDFSGTATVYRVIETWAERTPEAVAIAAPGRKPLSYRRLAGHVVNVIKQLREAGIGKNDPVAMLAPNGPEMASAFLAICSGATFAPLNPVYRANEIDFSLSDLNAKVLMIQSGIDSPAMAVAQKHDIPIIELAPVLEAEAGIFTLTGEKNLHPARDGFAEADDVALLLHTSGTTSRPKLVPLTQTNICAAAHHIQTALQLGPQDRCLNVMPLFHIHGLIGAILSSLTAGASVVSTPGFNVPEFFAWLEESRPTWYTAVPTMHQAVLEHTPAHRDIIARCPLRLVRSASAPLPPRVMEEIESTFGIPVIESYGMTEAATQITSNRLPPFDRKPGSAGLPAGVEVAIMDEAGCLLPEGRSGEIVIRGAHVMSGYKGNPTANEEVFVNGWFRTGDEGYLDGDSFLFITGRLKEIINRGGEKVSPREIDEVLMTCPGIREALAFAVPHPTLGEDIAAAVVATDKIQVTESLIRQYLCGRLADFKLPSRIFIVDEIPKSSIGKVQRVGLAEKFAQQLNGEFVAPRNDLEIMVARIYSDVLGVERIGAADNFLALGGDSLRATQVISRLRAIFQIDLPIVTLFRKATVAELADEIARSVQAVDRTLIAEVLAELAGPSDEENRQQLVARADEVHVTRKI